MVIETTGLADPAPLIQSLLVDEVCKKYFVLDSVLAVVDAKHLPLHLPSVSVQPRPSFSSGRVTSKEAAPSDAVGFEALRQIAFADKVLINKIDLVSFHERDRIMEMVKNINPDVECIDSSYSKVALRDILDVKAYEDSKHSVVGHKIARMLERCKDALPNGAGSLKESKGFSFLPVDERGNLNLTKKGRSSSSNGAHSAMENISTVSLTLPMEEPLDLNNVNL